MEKTKRIDKIQKTAFVVLLFNMVYSVYHVVLSVMMISWWFLTVGIYYVILSTSRFAVLRCKDNKKYLIRFTGVMLMALSFSLVGTVILSFVKDRGTVFPLVAMLTIATYSFANITLTIIKWVKVRRSTSAKMIALRNISLANAFVSIFSLQRSMLVSFEGMSISEIRIMNLATGFAVCVIVFLLGLNLVQQKRIQKETIVLKSYH